MTTTITYAQYERALAGVLHPDRVEAWSLPGPLARFIEELKTDISNIATEIGAGVGDIIKAFMNRDAFALFKSLRFSLTAIFKGIHLLTGLLPRGLTAMFKELHESGFIDKIRSGVATFDDLLNRHPIIKKLAGPALAALLLWMWMQMMFVGDPWSDFDLMSVGKALVGQYTIHDLFTSPEGLAGLALFIAGIMTPGLGIAWLGDTVTNLLAAIVMTLARRYAPKVYSAIKAHIPKSKMVRASIVSADEYVKFTYNGPQVVFTDANRVNVNIRKGSVIRINASRKAATGLLMMADGRQFTISRSEAAELFPVRYQK